MTFSVKDILDIVAYVRLNLILFDYKIFEQNVPL